MITYRCSASCEPTKTKPERESLDEAIFRANDFLYRITDTCASQEHRIFISGSGNFRKTLYPDYKAHRASVTKPLHLEPLRELLVREWGAEIVDGYEADDGIGMAHTEHTIIVSNDKDFKQLEGTHFNPVKSEFEVVDSQMAAYNFYFQMLKGDAADNIRGIDGIGDVRAKRILDGLDPGAMHSTVFEYYNNPERFLLNYRLLRILRSIEDFHEITAGLDETTERESEGEESPEVSGAKDLINLSESD
jgi:5'-3' exonuclease